MFEFIILLSIIIASFSVLLSFIFDIVQNLKYRNHLPLFFGIIVVAILLLINPQQEPGIEGQLYTLKALSQYLLLPLFVFAPLPYIEKGTGTVLSKFSVFYGAVVTVNFYFAFLLYGNYYFEHFWQVDGLFWTAGASIPAFVIFYGLYRCELFIAQTPDEKSFGIKPENGKDSRSSEIRKNFVIILCFLVFCVPSFLIASLGNTESCGCFEVYSVDQSRISNATIVPLTENDFRNFSRMAPIIRDGKTISGGCMSSGYEPNICVGKGIFRCNEEQQFYQYRDNILEYNGRYYFIVQTCVV
jgi:hypothetical protein